MYLKNAEYNFSYCFLLKYLKTSDKNTRKRILKLQSVNGVWRKFLFSLERTGGKSCLRANPVCSGAASINSRSLATTIIR